jgi:AraC family transcriptional regulator
VNYGLMAHFDQELGQFDYMADEAVAEAVDLPAGMTSWYIPANTYAVFETTLPRIGETFGYIYDVWPPASGYQHAAAPFFERYGETFNPDDPTSTLSIYIPLEKKA